MQKVTGIEFVGLQGDLKCVHLYENAILEGIVLANKELKNYNVPYMFYTKSITSDLKHLDPDAFLISNYNPDEYVKVEMLAPIK